MLFRRGMFLRWTTPMMFSRLWRIWRYRWWTVTAARWFTWTLWWRIDLLLFLLWVTFLMTMLMMSSGVSRLTLFFRFTRVWWWLLSRLRLMIMSMLWSLMIPRLTPLLLLTLLISRVLIAAALCSDLPWHRGFQIVCILLMVGIVGLIILFLAAISTDCFYEVTLGGLMLQMLAALLNFACVVLYLHLVRLRLLARLPRVDTSWYLVVISMSMSSTIANLLMSTFCVTLILRVSMQMLLIVVVSCRWRILREALTVVVRSVCLMQKVVRMVSVVIQRSGFHLGVSKACESSILSKLLLYSGSFFFAWTKVIRN